MLEACSELQRHNKRDVKEIEAPYHIIATKWNEKKKRKKPIRIIVLNVIHLRDQMFWRHSGSIKSFQVLLKTADIYSLINIYNQVSNKY